MKWVVRDETVRRWVGGEDPFLRVQGIRGRIVRSKEGRTTQRFEIDGKGYYVKLHQGVGWREIIKNLLQLRLPVIGADNEWLAINRLKQLGVTTLNAVAYGKRGVNPARQESFLITEELTGTLSLAQLTETWSVQPPSFALKKALIEQVAAIARVVHRDGINHRDMYICHFLVDISKGVNNLSADKLTLYLVDLHRAQMRKAVPRRWLVKDLASLYFSALDIPITRNDVRRFWKCYCQKSLRESLTGQKALLERVSQRAVRLYRRDFNRDPSLPFDH